MTGTARQQMYLVAMLSSFSARSVTQMTHSMNICLTMQRCMQGCYVCLIVACAARIPRQYQHLQTATSCVRAPRHDVCDNVTNICPGALRHEKNGIRLCKTKFVACMLRQVQTHRWSSCDTLQFYESLLERLGGWAMPKGTAYSIFLWLENLRQS